MAAVNTPLPVVHSEHLAPGTLVCDLSVPEGVDTAGRRDVEVIRGGVARLPNNEDLCIAGFPLETGLVFGCMAESMILALEGIRDRSFTGDLTPGHVRRIDALSKKHGFQLADYKRQAVLGRFHGNA